MNLETAANFPNIWAVQSATDNENIIFRVGKSNGVGIRFEQNNLTISASNFSADASGNVSMTGAVTATSGNIGGFLISQNEISSSATPKRGLVLKPNDAIRGYGSTAHSSRGTGGKFSFGAGQSIAPAAGASQNTFDPSTTAGIPGNEAD